jgi:hypothetical protein
VGLLVFGGAPRGFGVTLRAVAYGSTPQLLGVLPICGAIVGGLWSMVLVIIGAIYGHGTDGWRAILGYFLPLILCCCLVWVLLSTFGLLGALAG